MEKKFLSLDKNTIKKITIGLAIISSRCLYSK